MKKVIIFQRGNWFEFSPTGHKYFIKDDLKVNGLSNLIITLHKNNCVVSENRGYNLNGTLWKPEEINAMLREVYEA